MHTKTLGMVTCDFKTEDLTNNISKGDGTYFEVTEKDTLAVTLRVHVEKGVIIHFIKCQIWHGNTNGHFWSGANVIHIYIPSLPTPENVKWYIEDSPPFRSTLVHEITHWLDYLSITHLKNREKTQKAGDNSKDTVYYIDEYEVNARFRAAMEGYMWFMDKPDTYPLIWTQEGFQHDSRDLLGGIFDINRAKIYNKRRQSKMKKIERRVKKRIDAMLIETRDNIRSDFIDRTATNLASTSATIEVIEKGLKGKFTWRFTVPPIPPPADIINEIVEKIKVLRSASS